MFGLQTLEFFQLELEGGWEDGDVGEGAGRELAGGYEVMTAGTGVNCCGRRGELCQWEGGESRGCAAALTGTAEIKDRFFVDGTEAAVCSCSCSCSSPAEVEGAVGRGGGDGASSCSGSFFAGEI